jgi:hypothetical protein
MVRKMNNLIFKVALAADPNITSGFQMRLGGRNLSQTGQWSLFNSAHKNWLFYFLS